MEESRKKSMEFLCKLGQFGVGKSLVLGLYDFVAPEELKE